MRMLQTSEDLSFTYEALRELTAGDWYRERLDSHFAGERPVSALASVHDPIPPSPIFSAITYGPTRSPSCSESPQPERASTL